MDPPSTVLLGASTQDPVVFLITHAREAIRTVSWASSGVEPTYDRGIRRDEPSFPNGCGS